MMDSRREGKGLGYAPYRLRSIWTSVQPTLYVCTNGQEQTAHLTLWRHQVLVDGMKRPLIPYAGYDPDEDRDISPPPGAYFVRDVVAYFRSGLDTHAISRLMF